MVYKCGVTTTDPETKKSECEEEYGELSSWECSGIYCNEKSQALERQARFIENATDRESREAIPNDDGPEEGNWYVCWFRVNDE